VQIVGPIESFYRWDGKVETATEWQCLIKTRTELLSIVEQAIGAIHKYELPEIIALPIIDGSELYLSWLRAETAGR
jgi:periplasmic divalent cation tolerance protein